MKKFASKYAKRLEIQAYSLTHSITSTYTHAHTHTHKHTHTHTQCTQTYKHAHKHNLYTHVCVSGGFNGGGAS